jgi:ribosomal protein S18 acetylase RimI-like enzyme
VAVALRPSTDFTSAQLAELFTAAYEGYFVPFNIDQAAFENMVEAFDLDLGGSLVALDGDTPVGLANLGLRGERTWLGGVGVVPSHRRGGIGEQLTRALMDSARERGATAMLLEVITENTPAIALYEKLGFEHVRELELLSLPEAAGGGGAEEVPLDVAQALVAARREEPEPWQREDQTVAHLVGRDPAPQALVSGDAAAIYRMSGPAASLIQAAGGDTGLRGIITALRALGPVSAVNYPAGGAVSTVLREAGAEVPWRQYEMVAPL